MRARERENRHCALIDVWIETGGRGMRRQVAETTRSELSVRHIDNEKK